MTKAVVDTTVLVDALLKTDSQRDRALAFEDRDMLDGSGPSYYGLRAGPVRRLREALKATVDATCDLK